MMISLFKLNVIYHFLFLQFLSIVGKLNDKFYVCYTNVLLFSIFSQSIFCFLHNFKVHASEECKVSKYSVEHLSTQNVNVTFELILAENYQELDPSLPSTILEIKNRGGHRCWHKHSTFLDHLLGVHNILRLWDQSLTTARVGLLHSAYSNSYVNLALFDPKLDDERNTMSEMVGKEAEELIYLFCIINRQSIVVDTILAQRKIPNMLDVPHLRNENVTVHLSSDTLRLLVVFTMADVADQYFGWQDQLFGGFEEENSMLKPGEDDVTKHNSMALWPGLSKPGLWMSYVSELGIVLSSFSDDDEKIPVPPIFDNCTKILLREDEAKARDLYWSVVMDVIPNQDIINTLLEASRLNPWFFECHVMLAQKYLHLNENVKAEQSAKQALDLQIMWGTAYDKRMSFPAWVAWTRVLYQRAINNEGWPSNSWDVNNFGMVYF